MKITAGRRGDAAREAKDKAENKFYWDSYKRAKVLPAIKQERESRINSTIADIRRQIDRLIADGYAKQIFEDDVYVYIDTGSGNRTFSARNKYLDETEGKDNNRYHFNDSNPEQITVRVGTKDKSNPPFRWEWRARFDYEWRGRGDDGKYCLKNDVSSYNFGSSDPRDIEYFSASGEILKALTKLNWEKILTTDPYEGMLDMYKQLPDAPDKDVLIDMGETDKWGSKKYSKYNNAIEEADIADALDEWKQGKKWLYVGTSNSYHEDDPDYDRTTQLMSDHYFRSGWYRYKGETDKYYKVDYLPYYEGRKKLDNDEPASRGQYQYEDKVRKTDFERSIYYPITWYGKA